MKKQLGLTLAALLTAFSGISFAAQSNEVDRRNGLEHQNSVIFLTDSEMKDSVGGLSVATVDTVSGPVCIPLKKPLWVHPIGAGFAPFTPGGQTGGQPIVRPIVRPIGQGVMVQPVIFWPCQPVGVR